MKKKKKKENEEEDKWMEEQQIQINLELTLKKLIKEYNRRAGIQATSFKMEGSGIIFFVK